MEIRGNDRLIDLKGATIYDDDIYVRGHGNTIKNAHLVRSIIQVDGTNNRVTRLEFHEARKADGPLAWLYGGDKYALKKSGNVIENCEFWDHSQSQGTIELVGCGAIARNNRLHNQANPYPAIKMIGACHRVTGNEIEYLYRAGFDDDAGVISCGRRLDWPGGIVRNNRIKMVTELSEDQLASLYIAALYCDDMLSLSSWLGNTVTGFPIAYKLGGGSWNSCTGNTFNRCGRGVVMDARGLNWMVGDKAAETAKSLADIPRDSAMWDKYGTFLKRWTPKPVGNTITDNVYQDCLVKQNLVNSELYGLNLIETTTVPAGSV